MHTKTTINYTHSREHTRNATHTKNTQSQHMHAQKTAYIHTHKHRLSRNKCNVHAQVQITHMHIKCFNQHEIEQVTIYL